MAKNVQEEDVGSHEVRSHRRVYGGLRGRTLEETADFWKTWRKYDRPMEQAVTWADVNAKIALKEVAPFTDGYWEMYDAALMLME